MPKLTPIYDLPTPEKFKADLLKEMKRLSVKKADLARATGKLPSVIARFFNSTKSPDYKTMRLMAQGVVDAANSL
jgi:predicted transcriptional regulator